jgi:ABC-type multidrug transport system ATPase subunit
MAAIDLKDRKISTLEKQEKSKVAIAQALISNLGLLIL